MHVNKQNRLRRIYAARQRMRRNQLVRLVVHRTPRHIYAQLIKRTGEVVAAMSTLDSSLRSGSTGNQEAAKKVGALIAKRALEKGIKSVAFDRAGFKYHGRVKALAEAAREAGLSF